MKEYLKKLSVVILLMMSTVPLMAQVSGGVLTDSIKKNFIRQSIIFPQEKVYVQNDKPYYVTGENIWFRAYLVDAVSHVADYSSRYIYAELINPVNEIAVRVKIRPTLGAYSGYITIPENLPSGDYQLRLYTRFMENMDEAYFFKKKIRVGDPLGGLYRTEATFSYEKKDKVNIELRFVDVKTGNTIRPDEVRVKNDDKFIARGGANFKEYKPNEKSSVNFSLKDPAERLHNQLYIEYDYLSKFHKEYIPIPAAGDDFDVSFLPEGGNQPTGINHIIAFKALDSNGAGEEIHGRIENSKGELIAEINTVHKGMGSFVLNAAAGEKYFAICRNSKGLEKRFELPAANNNTYSLKTNWQKDNLYITVSKSSDIQSSVPLYLVMHCRGSVLYAAQWDSAKEFINIDKNTLPTGVLHLLLTDANLNPLSERLVFSRNRKDDIKLAFGTDKTSYGRRDKVRATFDITDIKNRPVMASLSVSVTDDKDISPDKDVNILSTLLLTSELKGYIESPAYYFTDAGNTAIAHLDLLMMTQGWRRYNIPDVLKGIFTEPASPLEIGQEISGIVTSVARKKPMENIEVGVMSTDVGFADLIYTDKDGRFAFNGFEYPEGTNYLIRAIKDDKSNWVRLTLDEELFPDAKDYGITDPWYNNDAEHAYEAYLEKADNKYVLENGMRMIYLKEVEVSARRRPDITMTPAAMTADKIVTYKDIEEEGYYSIVDILQRIAGVMVYNNMIIMRSRTTIGDKSPEPAVYIDGVYIEPGTMYFMGGTISYLEQINIYDVKQIDVVKYATVLFGYKGTQGVIYITMKDGSEMKSSSAVFNVESISPLGYQPAKEFYSPKYETLDQKNVNTPDLRTTIYWNPDIRTSSEGNADIEFYTADARSAYSVVIEGVTVDGQLVYAVEKIDCSKE